MKIRFIFIVALVLLMAGCGEDSDELMEGQFPSATITSPADSSQVFGIVKIAVDAMDSSAISVVELFIDGEAVEVFGTVPYEYDWDTTKLDDRSIHTIYAKTIDDEGYTAGTDIVKVTVRNSGITGNTYTNWKYGFQISVPSPEWTIYAGNIENSAIETELPFLVSISSGLLGSSTAVITVGAEVFTGNAARYEELMEFQFGGVKMGITRDIKIDDIPAKELHIRYEQFFAPTISCKLIYLIKDGVAYLIMGATDEHAYPIYEKDIDAVIDTIEFL